MHYAGKCVRGAVFMDDAALFPILNLLQPGTVAVFAGESGAGKTTLVLNLAQLAAKDRPVTVLYYENADRMNHALSALKKQYPNIRGVHGVPDYDKTVLGTESVADQEGLVIVEGIHVYAKMRVWPLVPPGPGGIRDFHRAMEMAIEKFATVTRQRRAALLVTVTVSPTYTRSGSWLPSEYVHLESKHYPLLDAVDVFAWVKPVTGWTYRHNAGVAKLGGELKLFKPRQEVLPLPAVP